ncbi:MAG: AAA family ATPase [bacterium]
MVEEKQPEADPIKFITCPNCNGSGRAKIGPCKNCHGLGFGAFFEDKFFYFNHHITNTTIALDHFKKTIYFFLDLITYVLGGMGLISLGWWLYQVSESLASLGDLFFWQSDSYLVLIFWLSIFVDMFIIYRVSEKYDDEKKIPKPDYDKMHSVHSLPNTWQELSKTKKRINVIDGCDEKVLEALAKAHSIAGKFKHDQIRAIHIFGGLLAVSGEVSALFGRLNVDQQVFASKLGNQLNKLPEVNQPVNFGNEAKEVMIRSYIKAYKACLDHISPIGLMLPCYGQDENIIEILYDMEVDKDKLANVVAWFRINERLIKNYKLYSKMARFKPSNTMDRAYTALATPLLNNFSYDLTLAAKYGRLDLCVGRDKEIAKILSALESGNYGVLLVGPEGVGKNTIMGGIAQLMVTEQVPKMLRDKRLLELDIAQMIGGATPAQAQERMLIIVNEIARAKNIILYIKDIENIAGITSGQEQSLDLSEILINALNRRTMIAFASATDVNYHKYIEGLPLDSGMSKVMVGEPEINNAIQMIESKIAFLETKYQVYFSYSSIADAVMLTDKYMHDKHLPAKAIEVLEATVVHVSKIKGPKALVEREDVARIISDKTRIPVTRVSQEESHELLNLEQKIHEQMVNQEDAVKMVAESLRRARVQLRAGERPIANFLFLGPTGVGKTELAKTVSKVYFGKEEYMIRIDMSEYQHADSIKKMIGSADGTKGYLTEAVRKAPFSLILLDEIEKAHPDILNLFLQVMDDGRLTDGQGRTIDFTNSILIATSNIGALFIQEQVRNNVDLKSIKQDIIDNHLNQKMRPEMINRFDGIIVFRPLSMDHVTAIAKLMLKGVDKMLEAKGIDLQITDPGARKLAEQGYQPEFGARPLRRLIQDKVENVIANKLLNNEISRRDIVKINDNAEIEVIKGREL